MIREVATTHKLDHLKKVIENTPERGIISFTKAGLCEALQDIGYSICQEHGSLIGGIWGSAIIKYLFSTSEVKCPKL